MNLLNKVLMEITPNADRIPVSLTNRFSNRNEPSNVNVLPYIHIQRENRSKGSCNRADRLNMSMDPTVEVKYYKGIEDIKNSSFQVDGLCMDSFYMGNTSKYPKKNTFTKNLLSIQKDKTVFISSGRTNQKLSNDEEEERLLLKKLEETRAKKDLLLKIIVENERKQKERDEARQRMQQLLNTGATKIQVHWRLYKERKVLRENKQKRFIENMLETVAKAHLIVAQLADKLSQEDLKINKSIEVIQRNARKFLAKKKLRALWRLKIHDFISQKLLNTLTQAARKTVFKHIQSHASEKSRAEANTFFITCNPGYPLLSPGSDYSSISQQKDSKRFYRRKSIQGPVDYKRMKDAPSLIKRPSFFVNTSVNSYSSINTMESDQQKVDLPRRFRTKVSRGSVEDQSIGDISETVNPEDELSPQKTVEQKKDSVVLPDTPESDFEKTKIKIKARRNSIHISAPLVSEAPSRGSLKKNKKVAKAE